MTSGQKFKNEINYLFSLHCTKILRSARLAISALCKDLGPNAEIQPVKKFTENSKLTLVCSHLIQRYTILSQVNSATVFPGSDTASVT